MIRSRPELRARQQLTKAQRRRLRPRWPWWAPAGVAFVIIFFAPLLVKAIGAVVALGVILLVRRRPVGALSALIVLIPFHQLLFVTLYRIGAPAPLVRQGVQWKEILIIGLLLAGVRRARAERHRLDVVDVGGLLYVGLGLAYLVVPALFVRSGPGASLDLTTRLLGWRTDVLYVALFLACRHLRLTRRDARSLLRAFLWTLSIVAAVAVFEFTFSSLWNRIWIDWLDFSRYKLDILGSDPLTDKQLLAQDVRVYTKVAGRDVLRVGSVLLDYQGLSFYLVVGIGLLADRIVRGVASRRVYLALPLVGGAVLLTQTRSAVLAMGVVLVISLFRHSGQRSEQAAAARVRFTLVLAAVLVVAVPAALSLGLVDRFNGQDNYSSNQSHSNSFGLSYGTLLANPLGRGLATAAGAGQRADVSGTVITETQPLQIGVQLGFAGLAFWLTVVIGTIVVSGRLLSRAPPGPERGALAGMRTAFIGLVIGGLLLQNFIEFSVTWSLWALTGAALGSLEGHLHAEQADAAPAPAVRAHRWA